MTDRAALPAAPAEQLSNPKQLLQPEQQQQAEPVAWIVDGGKKSGQLLYTHEYELELVAPKIMCKPLYTAPPQRKPLTDAEICMAWLAIPDPVALGSKFLASKEIRDFARAIEQAHGIGEKP